MALRPGSFTQSDSDYATSMARAMEEAFEREWEGAMGAGKNAPPMNKQMKLMFIAVAQGVVKHLKEHNADFRITNSPGGTIVPEFLTEIQ